MVIYLSKEDIMRNKELQYKFTQVKKFSISQFLNYQILFSQWALIINLPSYRFRSLMKTILLLTSLTQSSCLNMAMTKYSFIQEILR